MRKLHQRHLAPRRRISAFTLIELLIVVSIIMILIAIVVSTNLTKYLGKARDSRRKQDLNKLSRILEDYYNDNQRYPVSDAEGKINSIDWGGSFSPYLSSLPKDPSSPGQEYYYLTDPIAQNFYALFAKLENSEDPDIASSGCGEVGCGPDREYSYVVHSPNVVMIAGLPNGQAPPPSGNGSGNGGPPGQGGQPTATSAPTATPGPSSTPEPSPTPVSPPGAGCKFYDCGYCSLCGGTDNRNCCDGECKDTGTGKRCLYVGCWYSQWDASCP